MPTEPTSKAPISIYVAWQGSPEILGFNHFEQAIDNRTDTVIYAVNKFVSLLAQGNPNIIELLGNDPELYVNMTPEGQMLLDESAAASL